MFCQAEQASKTAHPYSLRALSWVLALASQPQALDQMQAKTLCLQWLLNQNPNLKLNWKLNQKLSQKLNQKLNQKLDLLHQT